MPTDQSDTVCPLDLDALDVLDAANEPDDKTCPVVAAAVAAELERRDRRPCGPTHHLGCACHEARRDAEIEALRAERDEARRRIPRCTGPWLKGSGGHRVYGQCDEPADYIDREDGTTFCEAHLPALDRSHADYIGSIADERDALRAELADVDLVQWEIRVRGTGDDGAQRGGEHLRHDGARIRTRSGDVSDVAEQAAVLLTLEDHPEAARVVRGLSREAERLRTVIRTGGAMYRAERSCLGVPGGDDTDGVLRQATSFLGEVATALGIDAKNEPWLAIEYARRLRAAATDEVRAARALGAAVNDGTHDEEMAASTASANALAALEDVLNQAPRGPSGDER